MSARSTNLGELDEHYTARSSYPPRFAVLGGLGEGGRKGGDVALGYCRTQQQLLKFVLHLEVVMVKSWSGFEREIRVIVENGIC